MIPLKTVFSKLSQFFREEGSNPVVYQKKEAIIRIIGVTKSVTEVMLGEVKVDVSEFCGETNKLIEYELVHGSLRKATIKMNISIVPPNRASQIAIKRPLNNNVATVNQFSIMDLDRPAVGLDSRP